MAERASRAQTGLQQNLLAEYGTELGDMGVRDTPGRWLISVSVKRSPATSLNLDTSRLSCWFTSSARQGCAMVRIMAVGRGEAVCTREPCQLGN